MAERSAIDVWNRRLPLYSYLEPLVSGRRILEVGCGIGLGADFLASRGAAQVLAVDTDPAVIERARARYQRASLEFLAAADPAALGGAEGAFDVVLVPEAEELLRRPAAIAEWKRLLAAQGRLCVAVASADRRGAIEGLGYYELRETLAPLFASVRMFGQTPFLGFGLCEFEGDTAGLKVDAGLVEGGSEEPSHYVAVAGPDEPPGLGYALVQIPFAPFEARLLRGAARAETASGASAAEIARLPELEGQVARLLGEARLAEARALEAERKLAALGVDPDAIDDLRRSSREAASERDAARGQAQAERARADEAEKRLGEARHKLDDAITQAEGATRVARAQGEEIEEIRGRLRRAAEDRGELEEEVGKLRKALAQADESVATLIRRTAEERESLMERLAAGMRSQAEADALRDRLAEVSALREEGARLRERLAETEARAAASEQRVETQTSARVDELLESLARAEAAASRDRAELASLSERLRAAETELSDLRARAAGIPERDERIAHLEAERQEMTWRTEEAEDRFRRATARVEELERTGGKSQEMEEALAARDRAIEEFRKASAAHVDEAGRLRAAVSEQTALVAELEESVAAAEAKAAAADKDVESLRRSAGEAEDADRARRTRLAELEGKLLRAERDAEGREAGSAAAAEADQKLREAEARLAEARAEAEELPRLRAQLEKAEEQLWDAKEQIVAARERVGVLEGEAPGLRAERDEAERGRQAAADRLRALDEELAQAQAGRALAESAANRQLAGGAEIERLQRLGATLPRLADVEDSLRQQVGALVELERTIAAAGVQAQKSAKEEGALRQALEAKDTELQLALMEIDRLRSDVEAVRASAEEAAKTIADGTRAPEAGPGDREAEVILLHTTIANHRRRAAKLREEVEGYRGRAGRLSAAEVAGLLEEISSNLGDFEK